MHPSFVERAQLMDRIHEAGEAAIHYAKAGVVDKQLEIMAGTDAA